MDTIMDISATHGQPPLLYTENYCKSQQQHLQPLCWLAFSRIADARQLVVSRLSYKHYILRYTAFNPLQSGAAFL